MKIKINNIDRKKQIFLKKLKYKHFVVFIDNIQ